MSKTKADWQDVDKVLKVFYTLFSPVRRKYRSYFEKGIEKSRRPDLIGSGLIRRPEGW